MLNGTGESDSISSIKVVTDLRFDPFNG